MFTVWVTCLCCDVKKKRKIYGTLILMRKRFKFKHINLKLPPIIKHCYLIERLQLLTRNRHGCHQTLVNHSVIFLTQLFSTQLCNLITPTGDGLVNARTNKQRNVILCWISTLRPIYYFGDGIEMSGNLSNDFSFYCKRKSHDPFLAEIFKISFKTN